MCCRVLGQLRLEKAPSGLTDVSKLSQNHSSFRDKQQRLQLLLSCYSELACCEFVNLRYEQGAEITKTVIRSTRALCQKERQGFSVINEVQVSRRILSSFSGKFGWNVFKLQPWANANQNKEVHSVENSVQSIVQNHDKMLFFSVTRHIKLFIETVTLQTKMFSPENSGLGITKPMHNI